MIGVCHLTREFFISAYSFLYFTENSNLFLPYLVNTQQCALY